MDRLGGLWIAVIVGWLWTLLPLLASSDGAIGLGEGAGLLFTGGLVAFVWWGSSIAWRGVFAGRMRWVWLSVPASWLLACLLALTNLPLTARLVVSERALREYADGSDPDPPHYVNHKRIGAFDVAKVWRHERTVAFATGAGGGFTLAGVIYAPDGLPSEPLPREAEELLFARYTHLYGPWYRFEVGD